MEAAVTGRQEPEEPVARGKAHGPGLRSPPLTKELLALDMEALVMGAPKVRLSSAQLGGPRRLQPMSLALPAPQGMGRRAPSPRFLGALGRVAGALGKVTSQQGSGSVLSFPPGKILALSPLAQETGRLA
uniref:Uncharacterized protein n=1 Tax=Micrurus corallinus TaxID=54390 RepID=A0A2D4FTH0_MICCO